MKDVTILLQNQMPVVDSNTTVATLLNFLNSTDFSHFPVVEDGMWIGNVWKEDLLTLEGTTTLQELRTSFQYFSTEPMVHWTLLWEKFLQSNSTLLPVIDKNRNLLGVYCKKDFLELWDSIPSFKEKGTTIIVQKTDTAYSFSQISQLVESNNAKLLSLFIISFEEHLCTILIKTNGIHNSEIIQDLRRFDYEIVSKHLEDSFRNKISDNSEYLQKYLDI